MDTANEENPIKDLDQEDQRNTKSLVDNVSKSVSEATNTHFSPDQLTPPINQTIGAKKPDSNLLETLDHLILSEISGGERKSARFTPSGNLLNLTKKRIDQKAQKNPNNIVVTENKEAA